VPSSLKEGVTRWRAEDICARWALPQDSNPSTALVARHLSRLLVALESPKAGEAKQALVDLGNLRDALAAHAEHFEEREPARPARPAPVVPVPAQDVPPSVVVPADPFEWDDPRSALNAPDAPEPLETEPPMIVTGPKKRTRGTRITDPKALELAKRLEAFRTRKESARV